VIATDERADSPGPAHRRPVHAHHELGWLRHGPAQQRGYLPRVHPLQGGPVSNRSGGIVCDSFSGCDTLKGNAMLCGRNGAAFARARPALAAGKSV
jgi:hypothetical protein